MLGNTLIPQVEEICDACSKIELRANEAQFRLGEIDSKIIERQELLEMNSQSIKELDYLGGIGFGLAEFKKLRYLVAEIAQQSGITANAAIRNFFDDLESHFYDYVWLKAGEEIFYEAAKSCPCFRPSAV
jgi:hypothetical protein